MTAEEYFEIARDTVRRIERHPYMVQAMLSRETCKAQSYDSIGHGSGSTDARTLTDSRMDMEERFRRERDGMLAVVEDARAVCRGVRAANPHHSLWGDALELYYIEDMTIDTLACALYISRSQAYIELQRALEWVDAVGIARARDGMGQAALF